MSYDSFKEQVASEKIVLAIVHASKQLMGWTLHSGFTYKLNNFDVEAIVSIEDSGVALTEVTSLDLMGPGKFFNDRENKILYLETEFEDTPNASFIVLTKKLFFSTAPVVLPHDLNTGDSVYFEPTLKSTSAFGVEIDTINQTSEAIEGSGTLTLINDNAFWQANYDKLTFENKPCFIYSYSRGLEPTEAKLIFRGLIENRSYTQSQVQFSLKDQLSVLREPITIENVSELGERTPADLADAKQRMILGRVSGHVLTNLDQVLDGYPLAGTISVSVNTNIVTGTGTSFLTKLSPDDEIVIGEKSYTIATVTTDTSLTLTENYSGQENATNIALNIKPSEPKRYMNRRWLVAGHATREPATTIQEGSKVSRLKLGSTKDMRDGDWIYVGTLGAGELVRISKVVNTQLVNLSASLTSIPETGTPVSRPSVQNVRIDDVLLVYEQDYTYDAATGILVLNEDAEANSAPIKQMANNLSFTNGSRTITGTALNSILKPGYTVSCVGQGVFFEVLSVDSDTQATLRTPATFTQAAQKGLYKSFILDPDNSVVTCDVLGRTANGAKTGELLETAPKIVKALLEDAGLSAQIDTDGFEAANKIAYQPIGLVIPQRFNDTKTPTFREVLNRINPSVFGCLVQTSDFKLNYVVLQPDKKATALRLDEADILDFKINSVGDKIAKTTRVFYKPLEYNFLLKKESDQSKQKTSDLAQYLIKTKRENNFTTVLADEVDALRHAARWGFILETATTSIRVKTKLKAIELDVGSVVDISHRKLYERFGSTGKRKLALVESVKKTGQDVEITLVDLSNGFNRVASITDYTSTWADTDEDGRIYGGFITDQYGLIDNDPDTAGLNLIW